MLLRYSLAIIVFCLFVTSCNNNKKDQPKDQDAVIANEPVINKDSLLTETGRSILSVLKSKQYDHLAQYFSDSVHFSPYATIASGTQTLSAAGFTTLLHDNKKINWGDYDGTGDPINLTVKEYIQKFVYNADFLNAEKTAVDSFIQTGNAVNDLKKVYTNARFIEYHFSGFDKKYDGMDWTSLRLVFEEKGGKYLLVAIVHDQWTI